VSGPFVLKPVTYYLDGRLYEWVFAVSMFASSILMLVWPNMIQGGAFQWLVVYFNVPRPLDQEFDRSQPYFPQSCGLNLRWHFLSCR
jgi:hypothetical protein